MIRWPRREEGVRDKVKGGMIIMNRRTALQRFAAAAALGGAVSVTNRLSGAGAAAESSATVLLDEPIGTIRPAVYGQFAEHIGGVIYDGIWVGPDSKIANIGGIRKALVEHVKQARAGSSSAGRAGASPTATTGATGSGPREQRPRRFGRWREVDRAEHVRHSRIPPVLQALRGRALSRGQRRHGLARGVPAVGRVLQRPGRLDHAGRRARAPTATASRSACATGAWATRAGAAAASSPPRTIAASTAEFTEWLPAYGVKLYLIAAGPNGNDLNWTRRFFAKWADWREAPIHGWAPHYYCGTTGHALKFSQRPVVRAAFTRPTGWRR